MITIPKTDLRNDPQWLDITGLDYTYRVAIDDGRGLALLRTAESAFSAHAHGGHRLNLVLDGRESEWCAGALREVGPGSVVFVPAGETHHSTRGQGPMRYLTLALPDRVPTHVADHPLGRSLVAPLLWRMVRTVLAPEPDAMQVDSLHAEIEATLIRPVWPADGDPSWLRLVIERIADDPQGIRSVDDLARFAGVHRCHLAKTVRNRFGRSIGELLMARRLQLAALRLAATDVAIASLAIDCGFYDQSHFGRLFRRRYGTTPARYRASFGGDPRA